MNRIAIRGIRSNVILLYDGSAIGLVYGVINSLYAQKSLSILVQLGAAINFWTRIVGWTNGWIFLIFALIFVGSLLYIQKMAQDVGESFRLKVIAGIVFFAASSILNYMAFRLPFLKIAEILSR